jgi:ornithine cyclodeaminase
MDECITVLEDLFREESQGLVENISRQRIRFPKSFANYMGGVLRGTGVYGLRHNSVTLLYNTETGKLDAVLEPGSMAWIRTGAATGVAVNYMSKPDASVVALFGTGRQAITQLEAVCAVRDVKLVKVYSRSEENRRRFAAEMKERLGVNIEPVATKEEALKGSQIVVVITTAREPVFDGALLAPGTHVTAAGSNSAFKREIDETTIQRADVIAIDNIEQAKMECGELIQAADRGVFRWAQACQLSDVVSGKVAGYPSDTAITLFESQGIGIEDIASSAYVLQKARAQGIGVELPF